jgi:circadian clock protein KaiC
VKKRSGRHESTIREMRMNSKGIEIGAPLEKFHGVLTGTPTYTGDANDLMDPFKAQNLEKSQHGS